MGGTERAEVSAEVEVTAKATRRRFTLEAGPARRRRSADGPRTFRTHETKRSSSWSGGPPGGGSARNALRRFRASASPQLGEPVNS